MSVAQRALELAWKADCGALKSDPYGRDDFDEIAAILRHYAEIMQSEPVATSTAGATEMTNNVITISGQSDAFDTSGVIERLEEFTEAVSKYRNEWSEVGTDEIVGIKGE